MTTCASPQRSGGGTLARAAVSSAVPTEALPPRGNNLRELLRLSAKLVFPNLGGADQRVEDITERQPVEQARRAFRADVGAMSLSARFPSHWDKRHSHSAPPTQQPQPRSAQLRVDHVAVLRCRPARSFSTFRTRYSGRMRPSSGRHPTIVPELLGGLSERRGCAAVRSGHRAADRRLACFSACVHEGASRPP